MKDDNSLNKEEKSPVEKEEKNSKPVLSEAMEVSSGDKRKNTIIELIVAFVIACIMFVAVALIETYSLGIEWKFYEQRMRLLCDSFFVSGVMGVLSWLLMLISNEGGFDIFVYGFKKYFVWTFTSKKHAKEAVPQTFYDYTMEKKGKKHHSFFPSLIVFSVFLLISFVFLILAQ